MAHDLLNRSNEFVGLDQRIWTILETGGFGTDATGGLVPTAADAVEHVTAKLELDIPREDAAHRSGRSKVTRLSGKKEGKISFESYIVPTDPNMDDEPQLPDAHPMILSAFGAVDQTNPLEIVYSFARASSKSFRMLEEGTHFSRLAVGCVMDSLTFTLPGDGKAMMKMEGFCQDLFCSGESTLAQALTGSAVAASKVIQDLTYTADATGSNGNLISIAYTAGATAGAEVVTVTGNAVSVQIETGVSTATQVKAAVDASGPAAALVNVTISGVGGNAQVTVAATFLTGGLGANDFKVASGQGPRFEAGSYIDIVDKDDGNTLKSTARLISARGEGVNSDIITVSGAALAAADTADIVIGHAPDYTATSSENALLGLKGTFTTANLGSIDCDLLSAELAIKNNYSPRNNGYGKDKICGFLSDKRREVSVKLEVLLTKENYEFYSSNKRFVADDLTITLAPQEIPAPENEATGRTFTFHFPKVEFNVPQVEQPSDGFIRLALEGVALASDINNVNDECTLTIS
jgi:hypothetical protein